MTPEQVEHKAKSMLANNATYSHCVDLKDESGPLQLYYRVFFEQCGQMKSFLVKKVNNGSLKVGWNG